MENFSTITPADLTLEHFIFHILIKDEDIPTYLDLVPLNANQREFFLQQFCVAVQKYTEYSFVDSQNSEIYSTLVKMMANPNEHFVTHSKTLAKGFHALHTGNVKDGVFIVSIVKTMEGNRFLFLLKVDHKKVLNYKLDKTEETVKAIVEEVANPIVQSKEALQKIAVIEMGGNFLWDIRANDRKTGSNPRVGLYFENFLSMKMRDTNKKMTEDAIATVRQWSALNEKDLNLEKKPSYYKNKAIDYMANHSSFDHNGFAEYVLNIEPEGKKDQIKESLVKHFEAVNIAGKNFAPTPNLLDLRFKKHIIKTAENVKIEWQGKLEDNFINFDYPSKENGQLHSIIIKTSNIRTIK